MSLLNRLFAVVKSKTVQCELLQGVQQRRHHLLAPLWFLDTLCLVLLMPHALLDKHTWWGGQSRSCCTAGVAKQ